MGKEVKEGICFECDDNIVTPYRKYFCSLACNKRNYRKRKKSGGESPHTLFLNSMKEQREKEEKFCLECKNSISRDNIDYYNWSTKQFCSKSCSVTCSNKNRQHSEKTKKKIKSKLIKINRISPYPYSKIFILECRDCNSPFVYKRKSKQLCKSCFEEFRKNHFVSMGRKSAKKQVIRSSREIELYELLSNNYDCLHNERIFNGFDADILIPKLKLAILWDGIWHYKQVGKLSYNFKQTQRNDKRRLIEIKKKNWNYIIIKDYDPLISPKEAYQVVLDFIEEKIFDVTVIGLKT